MDKFDLSVIIVSWNVSGLLRQNLTELINKTGVISCEIFVVDNNSSDGSAEMVRKEFPQVHLIANNENLGFAKANNQAIKESKGRYVLLLNPDMKVFDTTLSDMVKWMDRHPDAGLAGCHLVNENGETVPHVRRFPKLSDQLSIILKIPHLFPKVLDRYLQKDFDYSKEQEVDSIRGSFFMIRKEVIDQIGMLDERYFVWFEEVDFCKRVKETKWKIYYTPEVKCMDYVGKSFSQVMRYKTQKMFTESMLKYFKKWHGTGEYLVLAIFRPAGLLMAWVADRTRRRSNGRMAE